GLIGRQRGSKLMVVTKPEHHLVAGGVSRALALHDIRFFDVWEALTILEPPLAEAAALRRTDSDLQRLQAAGEHFKADNQASGPAVDHVADFFRQLGEATHNPALMLAQEPLIQLLAPSLRVLI